MATTYTTGMSVQAFFGELVPELAGNKIKEATDEQKAVSHSIAIIIEGDQSGTWSYSLNNGTVDVSEGLVDKANPIVVLQELTWRDAMEGLNEVIGQKIDIEQLLSIDTSILDPELLKLLDPFEGSLCMHITDADDTKIIVRFGTSAPEVPTCTIKLPPELAQEIATGKIQPASAFMAGQIMIEGDMALPMQLAGVIMQVMSDFPDLMKMAKTAME